MSPVQEVSYAATSRARSVAADVFWYPRLRVDGADVLHCPSFRGAVLGLEDAAGRHRLHDVAVLCAGRSGSTAGRGNSTRQVCRATGRPGSHSPRCGIADSEFTQARADRRPARHVAPDKIQRPADPGRGRSRPAGEKAEGAYTLAVGTPRSRERTWPGSARRRSKESCGIVGGARLGRRRAAGGEVVWLGEVGRRGELGAPVPRRARCLVYVFSLYEGYGLPVAVEALACGCPDRDDGRQPDAGDRRRRRDLRRCDECRVDPGRDRAGLPSPAPRRVASWAGRSSRPRLGRSTRRSRDPRRRRRARTAAHRRRDLRDEPAARAAAACRARPRKGSPR